MKYILYLLRNEDKVNRESTKENVWKEIRYLEFLLPGETPEEALKAMKEAGTPRLFITHMPFRFVQKHVLENKAKFVVVFRNPKDVLVSFFKHYQMSKSMGYFSGGFDEYFEMFKEKRIYGGDVIEHNAEWWKVRHLDNVFITTYEQMKQDLEGVIGKVAKFLGKPVSDETIAQITHLCSFGEMKKNEFVNGKVLADSGVFDFTKSTFIRKGEVGDWKNFFTEEQVKYIDQRTQQEWDPIGLKLEDV